ncbi:family 78 glycoside hydrolase catalytic domain [Glycomyces sp. NPDC048151]|uniref:family 78 glycoside hydrolase catalytic domain n=1 Tax=Glycomyces sp. NPDC048151 TaxID=3364002 RepID=UPI003721D939
MHPAPYDLRIDSGGDQFPVSGPAPRLSWKPASDAPSYEIEAVVDGATVSAEAAGHRLVAWPWAPLASAQRVEWRVRAPGGAWSARHAFESGLLDADWTARWISPVEAEDPGYGRRGAHVLARTFNAREVRSARLYATALGVYEAFVNGERAGTAELSPGSTSYDRTLYAQAADVTGAIRKGGNRIEIVLSDGWYRGQVGAFREPAQWGTVLGARAELHLEYEDGTSEVVGTNGSWTSAPSPITRADLMDGQTLDLQAPLSEPVPVLVDQVSAPAVGWSPAPPVRIVESRPAVKVAEVGDGVWVADFGQNASGWIALTDLGPAGTRTVIDYGEHVGPDGDLSTSNLDSFKPGEPPIAFVQRDVVVSDGSGAAFEPRHTVHGFQYARLQRDAPLDPDALRMRIVNTDLAPVGEFACSEEDLNRLHEVAKWSFQGNAVDVPTDCPTRERLGWTGDYQVFLPTATRLYDVLGFSRKWLRSVRDDQLPDGRIANFSPDGRQIKSHPDTQFAMMTGSAGWGDAITAVPWELYTAYGDVQVLEENWDAMVRWAAWQLATAASARHRSRIERSPEPAPHERHLWDGSFHWGEWCEPKEQGPDGTLVDPVKTNPTAWFMADKGEIGTAYLYRSVATLAKVASVLGREEDALHYDATAAAVRDAWHTEFLDVNGRTRSDTQASYVRALNFGLMPKRLRTQAAARLVELIREKGNHLTTGFLSTADLLPVLADTGHADVAYDLLFQRTSPSWLGMLDRGATTIWEDWDGVDERGDAHDSLNHYSKGAVIRFLHTHTLGLRQQEGSTAWESFTVAPVLHESLTWAKGSLDTPQGRIGVAWRAEDGEFHLTLAVPPGSTCRIRFPNGQEAAATEGAFDFVRPLRVAG